MAPARRLCSRTTPSAAPTGHPRRWVLLCAVLTLVSAVVWLLFASPWLALESVQVQGNSTVLADQVHQQVQPQLGVPLARLDTQQMAKQVLSIPEVAQAQLTRHWPHTVIITIRQRHAVARTDEPVSRLVDEQGVAFSAAPADAQLPVVSVSLAPGQPPVWGQMGQRPDQQDPAVVRARRLAVSTALQVGAALRTVPQLGASVRQVQVVDGQAVVQLSDSRQVIWGDDSEGEAKVKALLALVQPGSPTSSANTFDVRTPDFPVAGAAVTATPNQPPASAFSGND